MNRKIFLSLVLIGSTISAVTGATIAYFTDSASSASNTFTAGTMNITVDQSMQTISPVISDWAPGQTTEVRFNVVNSGTLPVNLRAFALGTWVGGGDANLVKVTKVEYFNGTDWVTVMSNTSGITGLVYYSPDGTNSSLNDLPAGITEEFRLTVLFDPTADNTYQGKSYEATITVEAKQTDPLATWPT